MANHITPNTQQPVSSIRKLQILLDSGDTELARELITKEGLQVEIINGRVIDASDATEAWLARFITNNGAMLELKNDVRKLAVVDDTVLIFGETGTGKEIIARALHGKRRKFVALNCAGLPEGLIESELFGHAANAFTGSSNKPKQGMVQEAAGGTLFLDEVGELTLDAQAKLLRVIQEKRVRKVGGLNEEEVTCRFVCATHADLSAMVKAKTFRQDLYARLSTFELNTWPLLERRGDVKLITESLEGGKELMAKYPELDKILPLGLNVRSIQRAVRRFKVLGKI